MKRLKFPAFLLVMAIALVGAFAFNTPPKKASNTTDTYYYIGANSLSDVQNPSKWITDGDPCGQSGSLPCSLDFSGGNRAAFDAHIAAYTSVNQAKMEAVTIRN